MMVLYGGGTVATATRTCTTICRCCWSAARRASSRAAVTSAIPKDTPMTNLLLTMLDMVGVKQEALGDSTGRLGLSLA